MAGLQSGEGRMMIDSVVWAQYSNVTDRHTDSHVATANAVRWAARIVRSSSTLKTISDNSTGNTCMQ